MKQTVVVLDNIRSLYNVGSIIRTSDALGIAEVMACGITPTPDHPRLWHMQKRDPDALVRKTALGGHSEVACTYVESAVAAVKKLKEQGYRCIAIEQSPLSQPLAKIDSRPLAIVIGNEKDGVTPDVLSLCDTAMEIPMHGKGISLNVAVAFGIAGYTILG